jgi:hypothetical protein
MTTAYTSLLGLALPVTGELSGTWGDTVNNSITSLLDSAVAGTTTLSADTTLTTTTGASNQARQAILLCTGHVANITITAPAQSKIYTVINASATYTVKIRGAGPTTGITIPVSSTATVAWNGSDFVDASGYINGNLKVNGALTVTGTATIGGNTAVTGTLSASGQIRTSGAISTNSVGLALGYSGSNVSLVGAWGSSGATRGILSFYLSDVAGTSGNEYMRLNDTGLAVTGTLSATGLATLTSSQITGATFPSSGSGLELVFQSGTSKLQSFNRTGSAYLPLTIDGTTVGVLSSGSAVATFTSTSLYTASTINVGIGTSSPAAKFEVSTGAGTKMRLTSTADNNADIDFYTNSVYQGIIEFNSVGGLIYTIPSLPLTFGTGNQERARIDSSGNVGIGTTSPSFRLHAVSSAAVVSRLGSTGGSGAFINFIDSGASPSVAPSVGAIGNNLVFMGDGSSSERARINSSGNLGIGTSSPTARLSLNTASANSIAATIGGLDYGGTKRGLTIKTFQSVGGDDCGVEFNAADGLAGYGAFKFAANTTTLATLDSVGNLGIGTTSPQARVEAYQSSSGSTAQVLRLANPNTAANTGAGIQWNLSSSNSVINGEISVYRDAATSGTMVFKNAYATGGALTESMRIDSSGNLLVGTTSAGARVYAVASGAQQAIRGDQSTAGAAAIYGTSSVNSGTGYVAYFTNTGSSTGLYISNTAAWQSTSDARLKTDVKDLDSTSKLLQLRPVDYLWKSQETSDEPTKRNLGFIAQEVKEVFPELVGVSPDGMFSVEYTGLIAPLVKAIQELKAEFDAYKASHP